MSRILNIILVSIIAVSLTTLGVWYFWITDKQSEIAQNDTSRGFSITTPVSSPTGSTYANAVSSLADRVPFVSSLRSQEGKMWHVTSAPVSALRFNSKGSSTLYFVERSTGYILQANPQGRTVTRLTNTLMPQAEKVTLGDADSVLFHTNQEGMRELFVGKIIQGTTTGALRGTTLQINARDSIWDAKNQSFAVLEESEDGSTVRSISADGRRISTLFQSGLQNWKLVWGGALFLQQKTSHLLTGVLLRTQKDERGVLVAGPGLSTITTSSAILWSQFQNGLPQVFVSDPVRGTLTPALQTIADKCSFIPTQNSRGSYDLSRVLCAVPENIPAEFPDSWYRGEVHTSDTWFMFDMRNATISRISVPLSTDSLDVMGPIVDDTGTYVAFIDATDESLWIMNIAK